MFSYGQSTTSPKQTYENAIDEINCLTLKKLLVSYNRQSVAQSIKQCKYSEIEAKLKTVKENVTKGYKTDFIDFAQNINAYKSKLENPSEYTLYADNFQKLTAYITKNFEIICNKYNKNDFIICSEAGKKSLDLQANINAITAKALAQIAPNTHNTTAQTSDPKPETATSSATTPKNNSLAADPEKALKAPQPTENTTQTIENQLNTPASPPNYESNHSTLTIIVVLLIAVIGALIWSFKEISDLKKEVNTLKKLNAITKQS